MSIPLSARRRCLCTDVKTGYTTRTPPPSVAATHATRLDPDDVALAGPHRERARGLRDVRAADAAAEDVEDEGLSEWEADQMKAKGVELFMKADYAAATKVFHEVLEGLEKGVQGKLENLKGIKRSLKLFLLPLIINVVHETTSPFRKETTRRSERAVCVFVDSVLTASCIRWRRRCFLSTHDGR